MREYGCEAGLVHRVGPKGPQLLRLVVPLQLLQHGAVHTLHLPALAGGELVATAEQIHQPSKIGVLPLSKKLNEGAEKVFAELSKYYNCEFDDRGNIGKRYRRQDEIGTPFCVTYDFDSEEDGAVTVRDRDTMEQERVKIEDLKAYFEKKFEW